MPLKISAVDKLGNYELFKGRNRTGIEAEPFFKLTNELFGKHHISYTQRGRDRFGKGVQIDHVVLL